jgi:hypothetical protein
MWITRFYFIVIVRVLLYAAACFFWLFVWLTSEPEAGVDKFLRSIGLSRTTRPHNPDDCTPHINENLKKIVHKVPGIRVKISSEYFVTLLWRLKMKIRKMKT